MDQFKQKNINIHYSYWGGFYRIENSLARGDLYIYKNHSGTMKRVGVESYVFFVNYLIYYQFPAKSIEKPLENVEFCGLQMNAPRGGLEFQKYFYYDWDIEIKPKGCKNLNT